MSETEDTDSIIQDIRAQAQQLEATEPTEAEQTEVQREEHQEEEDEFSNLQTTAARKEEYSRDMPSWVYSRYFSSIIQNAVEEAQKPKSSPHGLHRWAADNCHQWSKCLPETWFTVLMNNYPDLIGDINDTVADEDEDSRTYSDYRKYIDKVQDHHNSRTVNCDPLDTFDKIQQYKNRIEELEGAMKDLYKINKSLKEKADVKVSYEKRGEKDRAEKKYGIAPYNDTPFTRQESGRQAQSKPATGTTASSARAAILSQFKRQ